LLYSTTFNERDQGQRCSSEVARREIVVLILVYPAYHLQR